MVRNQVLILLLWVLALPALEASVYVPNPPSPPEVAASVDSSQQKKSWPERLIMNKLARKTKKAGQGRQERKVMEGFSTIGGSAVILGTVIMLVGAATAGGIMILLGGCLASLA